MKIASWNVNGLRSILQKGFENWLKTEAPDIVCLQEIKASRDQLKKISLRGYTPIWHPALRKGYSGVATLTRTKPKRVSQGMKTVDREGRVLTIEFDDFILINAYFPNSQRDHVRLPFKLAFCKEMLGYLQGFQRTQRNVILCGDFNIAHKEIDLKNPKANQNNAGFLPAEREWMDRFIDSSFVDSFRLFHPEPDQYTWWSYRPTLRERNIGWRLDYFFVNDDFNDKLIDVGHRTAVMGSDHCPIILEIKCG